MVEYWLWSAMQNSTGSGDFTNGAQNCSIAEGRRARQAKIIAIAAAITTNAVISSRQRMARFRIGRPGDSGGDRLSVGSSSAVWLAAALTSSGKQNWGT